MVDYGLNISEDFLKLISRRCISSLETSARYSAQDTSLNYEHRWFTIQWLLKRGCCFHPVIGELLIISGNEKWCEWYADEWGQFTERCYNFAVTSGSIKLLNLIFKTGIKLVISNIEDLTLRLIKRGSTTCIKWFEDKGIVFNICSKQIVKTLNANCNADILQGASSHLIDFPSIPTETGKLFCFTDVNLQPIFELKPSPLIIEFLAQLRKDRMGNSNLKLLERYMSDNVVL